MEVGFLTSPVDADIAIFLGLKLRDDCGEKMGDGKGGMNTYLSVDRI